MKSFFYAVILVCSITILLAAYLRSWATNIYISKNKDTLITLNKGQSLENFAQKLQEKKLISNAFFFHLYVKLFKDYRRFQAGKYDLIDINSPKLIIDKILKGDTYKDLIFEVVIPEGFSLKQIRDRLSNLNYDKEKLKKYSYSKELRKQFNIPFNSIEGYLYPATYRFYNTKPSIEKIYSSMIEKFYEMLPTNYINQLESMNLSLQKAIIISSLIEKETSIDQEKSLVAEVIFNRLEKNIPLGIDASLIYGIPNFDGNIRRKHLQDSSNLYNTRIHKGLPPGPICSPSLSSLKSLLTPSSKGYLFYVLKVGDKEKHHHFSKTLKEHNIHVKKLVNFQKKSLQK